MKRIIALLFCCFIASTPTWSQIDSAKPAPGEIVGDRESTTNQLFDRGEILWSESFGQGIPDDWVNSETNGIAMWEYRGLATSPDVYIGSRGSCIPEGQEGSDPIESATWADGFVIFDSNYWDDNIGPCIDGFGSGPSPAPHDAALETPSIDFSDDMEVFMQFHQFYKEWTNNTTAKVEYSVDGGEWMELYQLSIEQGNATEADDVVTLNVGDVAGGQSDFRVRFHFEGTYYYWMIDDLQFYVPEANNLTIQSTSFADFDIYNPDNLTGFENLEYTMYPDEMPPYFDFEVEVFNAGSQSQSDVILNVQIKNIDTEEVIYDESSLAANMVTQQVSTFTVPTFNMPATMGEYVITYSITQSEEDEIPDDNIYEFFFNINDVTFARDYRSTTGIYVPNAEYNTTAYEMGNMFVIDQPDMELHSVSVGCALGSTPGTPIYGAIYRLNINNFTETELLAQTPTFDIYWEGLNNLDEGKTMVIPFDEPITLDQDSAYLVVAGVPTGPQNVLFATSGDAEPLSSWVRFFPNSWYYMLENPIVRMDFGEVVGIEEKEAPVTILSQNYPNPFSDNTTIRFDLKSSADVRIIVNDYLGRRAHEMYVGNLPEGTHTQQLNRGPLAPGLYTYTLLVNDQLGATQSMIVAE